MKCAAGLGGFVACRALSQRNTDPTKASRPWDSVMHYTMSNQSLMEFGGEFSESLDSVSYISSGNAGDSSCSRFPITFMC